MKDNNANNNNSLGEERGRSKYNSSHHYSKLYDYSSRGGDGTTHNSNLFNINESYNNSKSFNKKSKKNSQSP